MEKGTVIIFFISHQEEKLMLSVFHPIVVLRETRPSKESRIPTATLKFMDDFVTLLIKKRPQKHTVSCPRFLLCPTQVFTLLKSLLLPSPTLLSFFPFWAFVAFICFFCRSEGILIYLCLTHF